MLLPALQAVLLVELHGGVYNKAANTLTYDVGLLSGDKTQSTAFFAAYAAYERVAAPGKGHTLSLAGPVSLFIDGCSNQQYYCFTSAGMNNPDVGNAFCGYVAGRAITPSTVRAHSLLGAYNLTVCVPSSSCFFRRCISGVPMCYQGGSCKSCHSTAGPCEAAYNNPTPFHNAWCGNTFTQSQVNTAYLTNADGEPKCEVANTQCETTPGGPGLNCYD